MSEASTSESSSSTASAATADPPAATAPSPHPAKEVVFIETSVADYQTLLAGLRPGIEVVLLDPAGDGLAQMAAWAGTHAGYDAIHLISHGAPGALQLGSLTLDAPEIAARGADLARLGAALSPHGDLLLYGCNVASGGGQNFVEALATATGADVAASSDATGAATRGGNWILEDSVGTIDTTLAIRPDAESAFQGLLGDPATGTTTFDGAATAGLAGGNGTATVSASNVLSTGWDFAATFQSTTSTINLLRSVSNGGVGSTGALQAGAASSDFVSSVTFTSDAGGEFDLQSLAINSTQGATNIVITGYRDGFAVTGATFSGSLPLGSLVNRTFTTVDLNSNDNFNDIDQFVITFSTPQNRFLFDNITVGPAITSSDITPPAVSSIAPTGSPADNAASATYRVIFDEAATNVSTDDFQLTATGSAGGIISAVSAVSGTTFDVTVSSISGTGGLRLDLKGNSDITDAAGNGNGTHGYVAAYTGGTVHSVDRVAPAAPTAGLATDSGAGATDGITNVGTVTVGGLEAGASWQYSTNGGTSWTTGSGTSFTLTAGSYTANQVEVRQTDTAGNTGSAAALGAVTVDATAPVFSQATVNGTSLVLTYSEATALDATDMPATGSFAVTVNAAPVTVSGVAVDAANKTVTLTLAAAVTVGQTVTVTYTDPTAGDDAHAIQDLAGNDAATLTAAPVTNSASDVTPPAVLAIAPSGGPASNAASVTYEVTFSETVNNVSTDDFLLTTTTGTATGTVAAVTAVNGTTFDVTVSGIGGTGGLRLDLKSNSDITDASGNGNGTHGYVAAYSGGTVHTVDRTAPGAPTAALATDSGASATDGITNIGTVTVGGLEAGASWQYSTNGGTSWTTGSGSSFTLASGSYTANQVEVRQTDAAGNVGAAALMGAITIDSTGPAAPVLGSVAALADGFINAAEKTAGITLTGTAEADSTVTLTIGGQTETAQITGTSWSYTLSAGDYTNLTAHPGAITVKATDATGNASTAAGTGALVVDVTRPVLQSATVDGNLLVLTFNESVGLNMSSPGDFTVTIGGQDYPVAGSGVAFTGHTATLTLPQAATAGDSVAITYADDLVTDTAGNGALHQTLASVTNTTGQQPPPVNGGGGGGGTSLIDGVEVSTIVTTGPDGSQSHVVTIPTVTTGRVNTDGATAVADIPLVTDAGGHALLSTQVPVGFGLTASGDTATKAAGSSLAGLIAEIQAHTVAGSADQTDLTHGGSGFLAGLETTAPLLVQTVVPTLAAGATPGDPLTITGLAATDGGPQTALVIDAAALPAGTRLQLDNVEFAVVIGQVHVTGGLGSQTVYGDSAAQTLILGPDDDVLHGGGGNDLVGSEGGNDRLYGDAGNDRLFGGAGDDLLDGGAGTDVVRVAGTTAQTVITEHGYANLTLTALTGTEGTDQLTGVEILRFDNGVRLANMPTGPMFHFDEKSYLARNPDVAAAVAAGGFTSGAQHFALFGQAEGRAAALTVQEDYYLAQNPDVAAAVAAGAFTSGAQHFALFGDAEGRNPTALFDTGWYLAQNPDVAAAVARGETTAYDHYSRYGWKEGRDPSVWFHSSAYLADYPDVAAAGVDPLEHFLDIGMREGRLAQPTDTGLWA